MRVFLLNQQKKELSMEQATLHILTIHDGRQFASLSHSESAQLHLKHGDNQVAYSSTFIGGGLDWQQV